MRLPPFSSLIAFDAVARHGTLTRAAIELNVSQPAISRRISSLEHDLGRPLLDRSTKPLKLNREGLELYEVLRSSFDRIGAVIERLREPANRHAVTISAGAGLTAYLLIPRLPQIEAAFPEFQIRIVSRTHEYDDDPAEELDIRFGKGELPGRASVKLLGERVFPVCSPGYLQGRKVPLTVDQLLSSRLLDMKVRGRPWFDWATWFDSVGLKRRGSLHVQRLASYPLAVDAAIAGKGICLAWDGLVGNLLRSGVLVRVMPQTATSGRGYFLSVAPGLSRDSPPRLVARWLVANVGDNSRVAASV